MAVTVKIDTGEELPVANLTENWINDQIGRRQRDGVAICIVVRIEIAGVNLRLATPACAGNGGGRPPNAREQEIIDLWNQLRLNSTDFTIGSVVAFLQQLRRFL